MRKLAALVAVLSLPSCSDEESTSGRSVIAGGDTFLELVEDARVAVRDGDLARAGQLYDEARALEPENAGLWVDIARLRFRGGEHLIAIDAADYALELDPEYAPALLMRAQLVRDAHGMVDALPWFEAAAQADPKNPEIVGDYAATLGDLGRYKDMLVVVRELARFAPDYPQVHYLQAVLAARGGDPVLAKNLLNRSGLAEQGVPSALMLDAIVDLQQGNYDTAAETLEDVSQSQPANIRVRELLARALWLGGRDRELVERFSALAERSETSPYLVMLVGRGLERMGERERAVEFIKRARSEREPRRIVLSRSGVGSGRLPAATAELRGFASSENNAVAQRFATELLSRAPYSADFHVLAGDTALISGDSQRALELYEVAARTRRSWPLTRKVIDAYRSNGNGLAANALLTRSIAGDPHNTDAILLLAQQSAEDEDWLRVEVLLDYAIALGAGNDLEVLALRAEAARARGDDAAAQEFDALRLELDPADFISG